MKQITFWVGLGILCLTGCHASVRMTADVSAHETVKADGITYQVPIQKTNSTVFSGDAFTYTGSSVSIVEKKGVLTVNGTDYGSVKSGDTVVIDSAGKVTVNGEPRKGQ